MEGFQDMVLRCPGRKEPQKFSYLQHTYIGTAFRMYAKLALVTFYNENLAITNEKPQILAVGQDRRSSV